MEVLWHAWARHAKVEQGGATLRIGGAGELLPTHEFAIRPCPNYFWLRIPLDGARGEVALSPVATMTCILFCERLGVDGYEDQDEREEEKRMGAAEWRGGVEGERVRGEEEEKDDQQQHDVEKGSCSRCPSPLVIPCYHCLSPPSTRPPSHRSIDRLRG